MKSRIRKLLKIFLLCCAALVVGLIAFTIWMRTGDEPPLDYSLMEVELGPSDPAVNGFAYLRMLHPDLSADFPHDFPSKYDSEEGIEIDFNHYENWDSDLFREIVETNEAFLESIDEALERSVLKPDIPLTVQNLSAMLPQYNDFVRLRILEARILAIEGDPEAALAELGTLAKQVKRFMQSGWGLIGILVSVHCVEVLSEEVLRFQAHYEFSPGQLRSLAKILDFTNPFSEMIDRSFREEFQFSRSAIEIQGDQSNFDEMEFLLGETPSGWRIAEKAMVFWGLRKNRTVNEFFLSYREIIEETQKASVERSFERIDQMEQKLRNGDWTAFLNRNPFGHYLTALLFPAVKRIIERTDLAKAKLAAARTALGLNAFYVERGYLPTRLDELVPDYLDEVPVDPFDGKPMRYSREKRIVYSAGTDYIDNDGSELPFAHEAGENPSDDDVAENDETEPTVPLRFSIGS